MVDGASGEPGAAGTDGGQGAAAGGGTVTGNTPAGGTPAAGGGVPDGAPGSAGGAGDPGAGGQHVQHWMTGIPDGTFDDRSKTILERFSDVPALAKGYMNAFNLVSRDKIPMPQNDQEFEEVYDRLGRPKEMSEYDLNLAETLPEQLRESMKGNQDWFRTVAHKIGLNKTQASKLYGEYAEAVANVQKQTGDKIDFEMKQASDALKQELGEAYDGKMTLANRAITEVGGEDLINVLEVSGLGRNPTVVKAFIKIGEMMAEDVGFDSQGQSTDTMADLDAQIAEIQANPAYMNAKDPQHKILVDKMQKLMLRRHPEPKAAPGAIRLF